MLKVLIVDDEPHAREVLAHHCSSDPNIAIVGRCQSAAEALKVIETGAVDLMFLDIRMPLFGGLDLLRGLHKPPLTVIVSAHQEHALDGFELDVIDYLLKPVGAERFQATLGKVRRRVAGQSAAVQERPDELVLKVDRALRRFRLAEVSSMQAQGNFVNIVGDWGSVLVTTTLKNLHTCLPTTQFIQIHRSYIVNRERIVEQHHDQVRLSDGQVIPIGRSYRNTHPIKPV